MTDEKTSAEPSAAAKRRAVAAAVAGGGSFAVMDALVKTLSGEYPVMQVVFLRSAFSLALVLAALPWCGGSAALRMTRFPAHLLRAFYAFIATVCFFYAFRHLPLADVYVVGHAAPFIVVALSIPLLGEKVSPHRWAAVGVGFIGVLIVLQPWNTASGAFSAHWAPWAASVGAAVFYALCVVQIRALAGSAGAVAMVATFLGCAMVCGGLLALPDWTAVAPADYGLVALMGIFGVGGQVFMTLSYRWGPAGLVAPFDYLALVWAIGLGYVLFGDVPSPAMLSGAAVIIAGGVYVLRREGA